MWTLLFAMCLVAVAVWFAYEVPDTANSGQTLGKRIIGIKVVRLESEERSASAGPSAGGAGSACRRCSGLLRRRASLCRSSTASSWSSTGPLRQALHDKAAATVVVQVPRTGAGRPAPQLRAATRTREVRHADSR